MRLTMLTDEFAGVTHYTGGIGTHFRAIARAARDSGWDIRVLLGHDPRAGELSLGEDDFAVEVLPVRPWRQVVRARCMAVAFDERLSALTEDDVVLAPEWGGWASRLTARAPRPFRLVTNLATSLAQVRAIEPLRGARLEQRVQDLAQVRAERRQATDSSALLAISSHILDWARRLWPLDGVPAAVIPNFLDAGEIARIEPRRPPQVPQGAPLIAYCGRVSRWKGADVVAAAMPSVWAEHPDARVVFVGRLPDHDPDILSADPRAVYLGNLPRDEALGAVAAADVGVFPSRFEGFGMAALEAKALGVPVVATTGSGFTDFCTDGVDAALVTPGDPSGLADAVIGLLSDDERRRCYAEAGRRRAEAFTAEAVGPTLVRFLRGDR
ncbi:glycosyltransferase family 4 protein [Geodermatophilus sp. URMC 63]